MAGINTNLYSLNAQRSLASSQNALATSLQRLSSGRRINTARDDAAGLAIAERLTTQVRGINQSMRNASDGISLAQTAEGALAEIGSNLQRIRELAVQAANAVNTSTDRAALNTEVQQLKAEIDRVARDTSFNGIHLLDGSFSGQALQVGADRNQLITLDALTSAHVAALGQSPGTTTYGLTIPPGTSVGSTTPFTVNVNGLVYDNAAASAQATKDSFMQALATAFDADPIADASYNVSTGDLTISNFVWANLGVDLSSIGGSSASLNAGDSYVMNVSSLNLAVATAGGPTPGFSSLALDTVAHAQDAIGTMDSALAQLNTQRASLGAVQNRLLSTVSGAQIAGENLSASRSRILDADYASETAAMTRAQILQQAGTAVLAQANTMPRNVLGLLGVR